MNVRAGRPAFARPYVGVHRSISLMSSSLLLQQCPAFIYICIYTQTDRFIVSSVRLNTQVAAGWDRNQAYFTPDGHLTP